MLRQTIVSTWIGAVIVNDRVDELIEEGGDDFLICRHWWVLSCKTIYKEFV